MKKILVIFIVMTSLIWISCSSDSGTDSRAEGPNPPEIVQANPPESAPTEVTQEMGEFSGEYSGYFINWTQWIDVLDEIEPEVSGDTLIWSRETPGGLFVTLKSFPTGDGSTTWQLWLTGTVQGQTYEDELVMQGVVSEDEKVGEYVIYMPGSNQETILLTYAWVIDEEGNLTVTTRNILGRESEFVNNADGSGSFTRWFNRELDQKSFESVWYADGSGWWKKYNILGIEIAGGTWGDSQAPQAPQMIPPTAPQNAPLEVQVSTQVYRGFFVNWLNWLEKLLEGDDYIVDGDTLIWTATNEESGETATLKYYENPDGSSVWKLWLDGGIYDNALVMEIFVSADKSTIQWTVYDPISGEPLVESLRQVDDEGNITLLYTIYDDGDSSEYEFQQNVDGSGGLIMWLDKENDLKKFEAQWNADGTGWWKKYDADGVTVIFEGTF